MFEQNADIVDLLRSFFVLPRPTTKITVPQRPRQHPALSLLHRSPTVRHTTVLPLQCYDRCANITARVLALQVCHVYHHLYPFLYEVSMLAWHPLIFTTLILQSKSVYTVPDSLYARLWQAFPQSIQATLFACPPSTSLISSTFPRTPSYSRVQQSVRSSGDRRLRQILIVTSCFH